MAYGVTETISMSAFVEGVFYLELLLSKCYVFPNPFINHLSSLLYHICKSPFIRFQAITLLFGTGVSTKRVELKFGLVFVRPFAIILFFL